MEDRLMNESMYNTTYLNLLASHAKQIEKLANLTPGSHDKQGYRAKDTNNADKPKVTPFKNLGQTYAGTAGLIGGTLGLSHVNNKGYIDGRRKLYHNTNNENVNSILQEGLKKSKANDPNNLTRRLFGNDESFNDLVYLSKNKTLADSVGTRRKQMESQKSPFQIPDIQAAKRLAKEQTTTLKASIPYEEYKKMRQVKNPELRGLSERDFIEKHISSGLNTSDKVNNFFAARGLTSKGTFVSPDDFDAKHFKKSKQYTKNSLGQVSDYIKKNPKRFAKGLGLGALSVGAVGGGGALALNGMKRNMDQGKAVRAQRESELAKM